MTPNLYDLNSAEGVRQIVAALFQGYNYRLYIEGQTRTHLRRRQCPENPPTA
ncbi:MAG: hypothetical protein OXU28_17785 [Chloroflexota bacterium]|nr:hypothetical protein [Chloroflexota bacterium]